YAGGPGAMASSGLGQSFEKNSGAWCRRWQCRWLGPAGAAQGDAAGLDAQDRKVIDANSGAALSAELGRIWDQIEEVGREEFRGRRRRCHVRQERGL
ncbi:MAG: hypothetical protein J2P50_02085, partial [Hyphomicrobiaceae bacterium]|nr:hypothetical protein [Hyphomicrobiaceae bacterium]